MNKIKKRNYIVIALLFLAIGLGSYVYFYYIPNQNAVLEAKEEAMLSAETHDFNEVLSYESKYMGDISNLSSLFSRLPLSDVPHTYELQSEQLKANIIYQKSYADLSRTEQRANLIYTGVASFVLIDNLKTVAFHFEDVTLTINRDTVSSYYKDLSALKDPETWASQVQTPLKNKDTMAKLFNQFFKASKN